MHSYILFPPFSRDNELIPSVISRSRVIYLGKTSFVISRSRVIHLVISGKQALFSRDLEIINSYLCGIEERDDQLFQSHWRHNELGRIRYGSETHWNTPILNQQLSCCISMTDPSCRIHCNMCVWMRVWMVVCLSICVSSVIDRRPAFAHSQLGLAPAPPQPSEEERGGGRRWMNAWMNV